MRALFVLTALLAGVNAQAYYDEHDDEYNEYDSQPYYDNSGYGVYGNGYSVPNYGNGYPAPAYGNGYGAPSYNDNSNGYYIRNGRRDAFITTPNGNKAQLPDPFEKYGQ